MSINQSAQGSSTYGIPRAAFEEDPSKLVLPEKTVEESIMFYKELSQKYRFLDSNIEERLARTEAKRSELVKNLQVVSMLQQSATVNSMEVDFELGDSMFARGIIENPAEVKVHLWLSSSAMVVYSPKEAEEMLAERIKETEALIEKTEEEQRFLKDQTNTADVNIARLYNHQLSLKQ